MSELLAAALPGADEKPPLGARAPRSFSDLVARFVALAGIAYAVGFVVILFHTMQINAPVVEAFEFQNIIAGLPVWILICIGVWLWPETLRRILAGWNDLDGLTRKALYFFIIGSAFVGPVVRYEAIVILGRFSASITVLILVSTTFVVSITMVLNLLEHRGFGNASVRALCNLVAFWSGVLLFLIVYALYVYPRLPQSWGGGRPVQVKLLLKDREVGALLNAQPTADALPAPPIPVSLYYRSSSYLLVSTAENQPLVQIPTDQVRGIVWLESQAK